MVQKATDKFYSMVYPALVDLQPITLGDINIRKHLMGWATGCYDTLTKDFDYSVFGWKDYQETYIEWALREQPWEVFRHLWFADDAYCRLFHNAVT